MTIACNLPFVSRLRFSLRRLGLLLLSPGLFVSELSRRPVTTAFKFQVALRLLR